MMLSRRGFLTLSSAATLSALARSRAVFASAPGEARFVFVFLRGGLDGLHALAPYADADYRLLRPLLALERQDVLDLDGYFGLHSALGDLLPLWTAGELAFVPATATRYRERSHFDGQNLLENGTQTPFGARDGWLNRAIMGLNDHDRRLGLSLGPSVPLILQGEARIQSWTNENIPDPSEDFLRRVGQMYRHDPFFAEAFQNARMGDDPETMMEVDQGAGEGGAFFTAAHVAGDLLAQPQGPRIGVLELGGWDTHARQPGRLTQRFRILGRGLMILRDALAEAWPNTVVMVASEFGRTAAENGSRGTDHGTGGLVMLAGGKIRGGQIGGAWPGLSARALFEDRDVLAANPCEGIFKSVLIEHLGLNPAYIEAAVFPESRSIAPLSGLLRTS